MANPVFATFEQLLAQHQWDAALACIRQLHVTHHDEAWLHQQVHIHWFRLGYRMGSARVMIGQVLPLVFALPVSFVHRSFGLAIRAHRAE